MKYKHKKTRKQKVIADYRHQIYALENKNIDTPNPAITVTAQTGADSYSHVLHGILKTGILTTLIVIGQLILFFLLKNHIITLPMVRY